jgi:hypothetical protein
MVFYYIIMINNGKIIDSEFYKGKEKYFMIEKKFPRFFCINRNYFYTKDVHTPMIHPEKNKGLFCTIDIKNGDVLAIEDVMENNSIASLMNDASFVYNEKTIYNDEVLDNLFVEYYNNLDNANIYIESYTNQYFNVHKHYYVARKDIPKGTEIVRNYNFTRLLNHIVAKQKESKKPIMSWLDSRYDTSGETTGMYDMSPLYTINDYWQE